MNKFGFIIHPTSRADVARYEPGAAGKGDAIIRKILSWMPPYLAAHVTGVRTPDGREIEGWFSAATFMPEDMLSLPREIVFTKILGAIDLAVEQGAQIVGLGAFTGIVGDGGITIAERSPIPVTTGNSLTIATGIESLFRGAAAMEIDPASATAVIIGATGSIGSACLEVIAQRVQHVIMVAPNATRLRAFHERIAPTLTATSEWTTDVRNAVRRSDLIFTAASSTTELFMPEDLRVGAVVCEVSLPHTLSERVLTARPDVLVIEGGNLRMPGAPQWERVREPGQTFDLGLGPGSALACMSETMVLALEGRFEPFTLGRGIKLERVREIAALAEQCGFTHAEMRAFGESISDEQLAVKRACAAVARKRSRSQLGNAVSAHATAASV